MECRLRPRVCAGQDRIQSPLLPSHEVRKGCWNTLAVTDYRTGVPCVVNHMQGDGHAGGMVSRRRALVVMEKELVVPSEVVVPVAGQGMHGLLYRYRDAQWRQYSTRCGEAGAVQVMRPRHWAAGPYPVRGSELRVRLYSLGSLESEAFGCGLWPRYLQPCRQQQAGSCMLPVIRLGLSRARRAATHELTFNIAVYSSSCSAGCTVPHAEQSAAGCASGIWTSRKSRFSVAHGSRHQHPA